MKVFSYFVLFILEIIIVAHAINTVRTASNIEGLKINNTTFDPAKWVAPPSIIKALPYSLVGFDLDHRRVYYFQSGKWKLRKIVEGGGEDLLNASKYLKQMHYKLANDGQKYAKPGDLYVDEFVLINDFGGWTVAELASVPTMKFFIESVSEFRKYEDEIPYGYYINVNAVAQAALNIARPQLGKFFERIEVYGTQKSKWIPKLLRRIPWDQLPEELGGFKNHSFPITL